MITNYNELCSFIESIDCGRPYFKIQVHQAAIGYSPLPFIRKSELLSSENWLERNIGLNLIRQFDPSQRRWIIRRDVVAKVNQSILITLLTAIQKCSDSKMAERTKLYKDYRFINGRNENNPEYISSVIGILNYYFSSPTDETCRSNVIGLLNILRKKYGATSRS